MGGVQERAVCSYSHEKQAMIKNFPLIFLKLLASVVLISVSCSASLFPCAFFSFYSSSSGTDRISAM